MNKKITKSIRYTILAFLTFSVAAILFSGCADRDKIDPKSSINPSKAATAPVSTPNTGAESTPDPNKGVDFDDFTQTGSNQTHAATPSTSVISDDPATPARSTAENNNTASNMAVTATPQLQSPQPTATQAGGEGEQTDWTKPVK